jgi:hypothetical protein
MTAGSISSMAAPSVPIKEFKKKDESTTGGGASRASSVAPATRNVSSATARSNSAGGAAVSRVGTVRKSEMETKVDSNRKGHRDERLTHRLRSSKTPMKR